MTKIYQLRRFIPGLVKSVLKYNRLVHAKQTTNNSINLWRSYVLTPNLVEYLLS